jgi:hypothetical protein
LSKSIIRYAKYYGAPTAVIGDSLIDVLSLLSMIYLGSSQPLTEPGVTIYFSQALKTKLSSGYIVHGSTYTVKSGDESGF